MKPSAEKRKATLVVGTTPDYIEWLRAIAPGRCLFLTDPLLRQGAKEPRPKANEEILCDLADYPLATARLVEHLTSRGIEVDGIVCFDDESMDLAALLAGHLSLPYPSRESIALCRDKYLSKVRWREAGVPCPRARMVHDGGEAERFFAEVGGRMVLKPLTGSGSEHVGLCRTPGECRSHYGAILSALESRGDNRLYRSAAPAHARIVAEEFIDGEEYSCDFIIDGDRTAPIRLTRKIRARNRPFGTIHGYVLCDDLPGKIRREAFSEMLGESARSLGIDRAICMVDFIVRNGEAVLLELAPRPGGDCLPHLLLKARGLDMLEFSLDFARGEYHLPEVHSDGPAPVYLGMRIIAKGGGVLGKIDVSVLKEDPRVLAIGLTKEPGHVIVMPPEDYDSWILGHVIARVEPGRDPVDQLIDLDGKISIVMDQNR